MDRKSLIEAFAKTKPLEGENVVRQLKLGAELELFEGLARAREESLALTYRIRLKSIEKQKDEYSQRLSSSLKEFIEILETDDPEYLRTIIVKENSTNKYHVWLQQDTDDIVGCMYTESAKSV
jgi:VIT1/CCC1 family predicted Fe2+/Mn2+ transporter